MQRELSVCCRISILNKVAYSNYYNLTCMISIYDVAFESVQQRFVGGSGQLAILLNNVELLAIALLGLLLLSLSPKFFN